MKYIAEQIITRVEISNEYCKGMNDQHDINKAKEKKISYNANKIGLFMCDILNLGSGYDLIFIMCNKR